MSANPHAYLLNDMDNFEKVCSAIHTEIETEACPCNIKGVSSSTFYSQKCLSKLTGEVSFANTSEEYTDCLLLSMCKHFFPENETMLQNLDGMCGTSEQGNCTIPEYTGFKSGNLEPSIKEKWGV